MKGTMRTILGLILLMGVAGGIDTATDGQLITLGVIGLAGMAMMFSGVTAMSESQM